MGGEQGDAEGRGVTSLVPDPLEVPLLTSTDAGKILDLGKTATADAMRRGEIPSVRIGARVLVPTASLRREVLGMDPPNAVTVEAIAAALRLILAENGEGPAAEAGPSDATTTDTAITQLRGDHHAA